MPERIRGPQEPRIPNAAELEALRVKVRAAIGRPQEIIVPIVLLMEDEVHPPQHGQIDTFKKIHTGEADLERARRTLEDSSSIWHDAHRVDHPDAEIARADEAIRISVEVAIGEAQGMLDQSSQLRQDMQAKGFVKAANDDTPFIAE
jgi:hypothetical protein